MLSPEAPIAGTFTRSGYLETMGTPDTGADYWVTAKDLAADPDVLSTSPGGWFCTAGTSMATPHGTAVAALIISKNGGSMHPDQVCADLRKASDDRLHRAGDFPSGPQQYPLCTGPEFTVDFARSVKGVGRTVSSRVNTNTRSVEVGARSSSPSTPAQSVRSLPFSSNMLWFVSSSPPSVEPSGSG